MPCPARLLLPRMPSPQQRAAARTPDSCLAIRVPHPSARSYVPFLSAYLLCGVAGGLAQLSLMHEARYSLESLGACGASAALCGLLGALLVHHWRNW